MSGNIKLNTPSNGSVTISTPDTASAVTVTIPAATDTATLNTQAQTLTNKTLTAAGSNTVEATSGPTSTQLAGNRNKIINGAMVINQRATAVTSSGYTVDRWGFNATQNSKATVQQSTSIYPVGFTASLGVTSSSSYSVLAGDYFVLSQPIEGLNCSDLAWGTASAKTVTLSFQVYSSLTGTFGGSLMNNAGNRCYPFSYTIGSSNTWTSVSITIAGDTTGTWATDTSTGIYVFFGLGAGSTYSGTAGSWAASNYRSSTGATSVVGTSGATFYITGVQLEKGATATPFENRLYGTELALCQRYYQFCGAASGFWFANNIFYAVGSYQTMRSTPSVSLQGSNLVDYAFGSPGQPSGTIAISAGASPCGAEFNIYLNTSSGTTNGQVMTIRASGSNSGIALSAEL